MCQVYHCREAIVETWVELPGVEIHAFKTLPSTQDYLLPLARQQPIHPLLCVTEHQTQGRGRGAKTWHSAPLETLCFSLCLRMDKPLHALGGITLAFGVALCEALETIGAQGLGIKWPNDIYVDGKKLAGILTETYVQSNGATYVIVGVGVNVDISDPSWADLRSCMNDALINQKALLITLVKALMAASNTYEQEGFSAFHAKYDMFDCLKGTRVSLEAEQRRFETTVLGVTESGELLIDEPPFKLFSGVFMPLSS
jgi:BirA family biotin operon repressor/biotin-[acetyl-CoA-carboxylase] ligase